MQSNNIHNNVIRQYSRLARKYDTVWKKYNTATIDETLKRVDTAGSKTILDIGCGTGILLDEVQQRENGIQTFGCDLSFEMLRQTTQKENGNLLHISVADATALPYPSDRFDTIFSTSVFHFIRNPNAALNEMYRVLKPNGRLILTDWCRRYRSIRMLDSLLKYIDPAHYRCYNLDECIKMLNDAGFSIERADCYKISSIWGMMTIVGRKM